MGGSRLELSDVIKPEQVQKLCERFLTATNLFGYIVNEKGNAITTFCGAKSDVETVQQYSSKDLEAELIDRVKQGSLEEQVVENTVYPNMLCAAVAIYGDKQHFMTWVIYGVLEEKGESFQGENGTYITDVSTTISEQRFYQSLDLLRDACTDILRSRNAILYAQMDSVRSRHSESEMSESLRRIEATTKIVHLFDRDASVEDLTTTALRVVGEHLQIGGAYLFCMNTEDNTMDIVGKWKQRGVVPFFDKSRKMKAFSFLSPDKPAVLSADALENNELGEELAEYNIHAIVAYPIIVPDEKMMYLCFVDNREDKRWQVEEIKFIRDSAKLVQNLVHKRNHKQSLESSYASMEAVMDNIHSAIYVRDRKTKEQLFANKILKETFATELLNNTIDSFLEQGVSKRRDKDSTEIYYKELDQWYELLYTKIVWINGREAEQFCLHDITDRKIYQKKIEQQAYTDFLTGLYNRMCCERDLAWYIDNSKKKKTQGALLYLDLDDFKHINDGLGHQYGDILLKAISHNLQTIQGIENNCYRMGGDEFVIIVPPESFGNLEAIIDEIKAIFSKPWYLKNADYYCTMSMGVTVFPNDDDSVQPLLAKADIAMYEAKKGGKNRIARYCNEFSVESNKRLDMEKNMRDATANGYREFEVYFQPITDVTKEDNPCTGAEALIRWNSAELGFVAPSEFIPLAEYLGLINPIGNYVLETACESCKKWNDSGHPNFKVNVNLSVIQLLQPDIVDVVAGTLAKTGLNPRNLTLEVTESLAINDMKRMQEILGGIKELGVRIALDDFGTGYSSLNHIREIPFDVIKVDRSFVRELSQDNYSQSFIKMVSELADTLGVAICAEGIETKEQYEILKGMNVKLIQGYYFGRPMTKLEFEGKYCVN